MDDILEIRKQSAKFHKVDLHLHSPLSKDWKNDSTTTYTSNPFLARFSLKDEITDEKLEAYANVLIKSGVSMVAITDHMRYSFGVKLADFVHRKGLKIVVLPGIELNVKINQPLISELRVHILAIFPSDISGKIERIFSAGKPSIADESNRSGEEEIQCDKIEDIINEIKKNDGLVIAAHIYTLSGYRYIYTKNALELVVKPYDDTAVPPEAAEVYKNVCNAVKDELAKFDALQVQTSTDPVHFFDGSGELRVPLIVASDTHHAEKVCDDKSVSYIKLGDLSFKCLKDAFKFPDTRIRFQNNLPETKPPRVLGVRITGIKGNKNAFFKNLKIGFSDNLTCIIGARGSGKSALIDGIRYAMGYNRTLNEVEKVREQVCNRQQHTLEESKIEVYYEKVDGTVHKIESTYDKQENYNTKVFDLNNNQLHIDDVEKCGDYPLNLYGWNELEFLGEDPKSQRENLDKFILSLNELKLQKQKFYASLGDNRALCSQALDVLDKYFIEQKGVVQFIRLEEYQNEFNKLNTPEMGEKFKDLDEINKKIRFLDELKGKFDGIIEAVAGISQIEYAEIPEQFKDIKIWCEEFLKTRLEIAKVNDRLVKGAAAMSGDLKALKTIVDIEHESLAKKQDEINKAIREAIGEAQSISAELRNNAKRRLDSAKEKFESYKKDLNALNELLQKREEILEEIKKTNQSIFATRDQEISAIKEKISLVNSDDFKIGLELNQSKDNSEFLKKLYENKCELDLPGQWKKGKVPELITDKNNPIQFVRAVLNKDTKALANKKKIKENTIEEIYTIDEKSAEKFINDNYPNEKLAGVDSIRVDKVKILRLLTIQELPFDDEFFILLGDKPIQFCSPGQRCSAMLPIVTLTSSAPIIIDQPEDNLDNRLVSRAIFRILSKLKETRQIILATHNPNILVSGDSEQVVVLNSDGNVEDCGSIDKPSIIKNIIDLMEGGKEAFEKRNKRYKDYL